MATASEEIQVTPPENEDRKSLSESRHLEIFQSSPLNLRLFTANEYDRMVAAGIFSEDERVELIEGVVLTMSPKGDPHSAATDRAAKCFIKRLDERALVKNQNPIRLDAHSEPEPDLVLAVPQEKEYSDRKPNPADILLILEVSDTTLRTDRQKKAHLYAAAGIIQYLVLNLKARELEDYREPRPDGYRSKRSHGAEQSFSLVAFPDVTIGVGELLPPE